MKKHLKLLSLVLAALAALSASSVTFAAPQNSKPSTSKKILKYGLIGTGITTATVLTAVGAYKIFGGKVIEINSEEDFKKINNCRETITKAIVNVENIPVRAFAFCKNLKEVDLAGVKSIQHLAFWNCHKLEILKNSSKVELIDMMAFTNCFSLKNIDLPGAKEVAQCAFHNCTSLERINMPNLETIALLALFGKWQNFTKADSYRSSITYYCPSLKEVNLPKNINPVFYEQFRGGEINEETF